MHVSTVMPMVFSFHIEDNKPSLLKRPRCGIPSRSSSPQLFNDRVIKRATVCDLTPCTPQLLRRRRSLRPRPMARGRRGPTPQPRPLPRGRGSRRRPLSGTSRRAWRTRPGAAGERSPRERRSPRGRRRVRGCRGVRPPGGTQTQTTVTTTPSSSPPRGSEADRASGMSGSLTGLCTHTLCVYIVTCVL